MPESTSYSETNNQSQGSEHHARDVNYEPADRNSSVGDQMSQVSELLRNGLESSDQDNHVEGEHDRQGEGEDNRNTNEPRKVFEKPPTTLQELAEGTGLTMEEVYNLAVPDGQEKGKTYTLSELKDAATKVNEVDLRQLELDQEHSDRTALLNRQQTELEDLFNLIPKEFRTKELTEQVSAKRESLILRERQKALDAIPSWKDETTRNTEINEMVEHLGDYGIPPSFLGTLADHRLMKYIRENMKRDQRVKATLKTIREKFPKQKASSNPPKGRTTPTASSKNVNTRTSQQVKQISNLLQHGD